MQFILNFNLLHVCSPLCISTAVKYKNLQNLRQGHLVDKEVGVFLSLRTPHLFFATSATEWLGVWILNKVGSSLGSAVYWLLANA